MTARTGLTCRSLPKFTASGIGSTAAAGPVVKVSTEWHVLKSPCPITWYVVCNDHQTTRVGKHVVGEGGLFWYIHSTGVGARAGAWVRWDESWDERKGDARGGGGDETCLVVYMYSKYKSKNPISYKVF